MAIKVNTLLSRKDREVSSIHFVIRRNGLRYYFYPSISVQVENWIDSDKLCRVGKKYPEGASINERIKRHIRIIEDVFCELETKLITPTQELFKSEVEKRIEAINEGAGGITSNRTKFIQYLEKRVASADKSKRSYTNYLALIKHLREFEAKTHSSISFNDVNVEFYNRFKTYMLEKEYKAGEIHKKYSKNYISFLFRMITTCMNETIGDLHNNKAYSDKRFKKEFENTDCIYLTIDEIQRIFDLEITFDLVKSAFKDLKNAGSVRKFKSLNKARLLFLSGCYTGLRISDYSRGEDFDISDDLIKVRTQKANKTVYIPMHHNLRYLIDNTDILSVKMDKTVINLRVKELGMLARISDEIKMSKTEGGQIVTRTYYKHELICSHTARRSFATNLYLSGVDIFAIKELLGHSKIETTIKYLKVSEEENAKRIAQHSFFTGK